MVASIWQPGAGRGVGLALALVFVTARAVYRRARRRASATDAKKAPSEPLAAPQASAGGGDSDAEQAFAQRDEDS
jgi:hypothetical protein